MVQLIVYFLLATSTIGLLLVLVRAMIRPKGVVSALIPLGFVQSWGVLFFPSSIFYFAESRLLSASFVIQVAAFVGLVKTWNSPKESSRKNRAARFATAFVAWGAWNALTDDLPLNENQARPSWYSYGWPVCFGTSGRGRFNMDDFDGNALAVDLFTWAMLISCSYLWIARLMRNYPQFSLRQWLGLVVGLFFAFAVMGGAHYGVLTSLTGSPLRYPNTAAHGGQIMPLSQAGLLVLAPVFVGCLSVGALAFDDLINGVKLLTFRRTTR